MAEYHRPLKIGDNKRPAKMDDDNDRILVNGIAIEDSNAEIFRDGNDIKFKDPSTGTKTLTELSASGGGGLDECCVQAYALMMGVL